MGSRRLFADLPSSRPVLRTWSGLCLVLALLLGGGGHATAEGGGIPASQHDQLINALVGWKTEGHIKVVLDKLRDSNRAGHPVVYAGVLGALFEDEAHTKAMDPAKRRTLFAALIAHLVKDQPEDDKAAILLTESFFPLLAKDPELVRELLEKRFLPDPITEIRKGRRRLLERAREALSANGALVRGGAIRLLSYCDCVDKADAIAAIHAALLEATRRSPEEAERILAAVARLLGHRFRSIDELTAFLNDNAASLGTPKAREVWNDTDRYRVHGELLAALVKRLGTHGGEQETAAKQAALDYGRAVIKGAKGPEALGVFFRAGRPRVVVLQREAVEAARRLEPKATAAWAGLLAAALAESDDPVVLHGVVGMLSQKFVGRPAEDDPLAPAVTPLAVAVAERLKRGVRSDRLELRQQLATALGRIGTAPLVQGVLNLRDEATAEAQQPVWARLIRALGVVQGGLVATLTPHYRRAGQARPEWERLAVAETLGQKGFRPSAAASSPGKPSTTNVEARQAALFLLHILHGTPGTAVALPGAKPEDPVTVIVFVGADALASDAAKAAIEGGTVLLAFAPAGPDVSGGVREAAVNSLNLHVGPATAAALGRAALEEGDVGAAALSTLSLQLARGNGDAAEALAAFIRSQPGEERLLAALQVILTGKLPSGTSESGRRARRSLAAATTGLLKQIDATIPVSEAVRRKAAEVAAKLHDLDALKPIYLAWHGLAPDDTEGRGVWIKLLGGLVTGVARAGSTNAPLQEKLDATIKGLVSDGGDHLENAGAFAAILGGLKDPGFVLKRLQAELALQYFGIQKGRTKDQRRVELDQVIALYGELVTEAPPKPADRLDMHAQLYDALHRRWTEWLKTGDPAENPVAFQLDALAAAVASRRSGVAARALESEAAALKASKSLTKEQRAQRDTLIKRVEDLAAKRKAAPKDPKADKPTKK